MLPRHSRRDMHQSPPGAIRPPKDICSTPQFITGATRLSPSITLSGCSRGRRSTLPAVPSGTRGCDWSHIACCCSRHSAERDVNQLRERNTGGHACKDKNIVKPQNLHSWYRSTHFLSTCRQQRFRASPRPYTVSSRFTHNPLPLHAIPTPPTPQACAFTHSHPCT